MTESLTYHTAKALTDVQRQAAKAVSWRTHDTCVKCAECGRTWGAHEGALCLTNDSVFRPVEEAKPGTIGPFGSGSVLTTSGDKIVGREEPANRLGTTEEQIAEVTKILRDVYESDPDTKRAPLPGYGERKFFDNFKGFEVSRRTTCQPQAAGFASPDLQATSPFSGSAYLLPKTA